MQNSKATEKKLSSKTGLPKWQPGFFVAELIMTLKKSKTEKGQAIFEYFILTTVVVAVVLFFTASKFFTNPTDPKKPGVKEICEGAFNKAVEEMLK